MFRETLLLLLISMVLTQGHSNLAKEVDAINASLLTKFPNANKQSPIVEAALICTLQCNWYVIQVNGVGNYRVRPDIATLSIQINANGLTVNDALNALSVKVSAVVATLAANGIPSSGMKTTYLNVYPNSSYVNGTTITYGQIAYLDMSITIPIPNPATSGALIAKIYDGLSLVSNINIYGVTFDLKDKTAAFVQARKLAFQDAVKRGKDLASSAGVILGDALTVTDTFYYSPYYYSNVVNGFVNINYNVNVVFAFK